jgi:hypothetical protein
MLLVLFWTISLRQSFTLGEQPLYEALLRSNLIGDQVL